MNGIKTLCYRIYIFLKEKQVVMVLGNPKRQDTGLENAEQKTPASLDREVRKELAC